MDEVQQIFPVWGTSSNANLSVYHYLISTESLFDLYNALTFIVLRIYNTALANMSLSKWTYSTIDLNVSLF